MAIITKGSCPWNLHPTRKGEKRECPECFGREIVENKCIKCGYTPETNDYIGRKKEWERKIEDVVIGITQEMVNGFLTLIDPMPIAETYINIIKIMDSAKLAKPTGKFIFRTSLGSKQNEE